MKIKILAAGKMGVRASHDNGDVVRVYADGFGWRDDEGNFYVPNWEGIGFEFVDEEPVNMNFTSSHKDLEITFESGKINVRDWTGNGDPVEYGCDTVEQLEELMGAWEVVSKYRLNKDS